MRPVIVLTCSGLTMIDDGRLAGHSPAVSPRDVAQVGYIASVERAGGAPVLLPNSPDRACVEAALERADGLLLTGGADVAPELYGRARHATVTVVDPVRDATEAAAIELALRRGIPILGICRGIQMLNVYFGGTLIQDIADQTGGNHRLKPPLPPEHPIRVEPGSRLAVVWGGELPVNSRHHQAVERLAPDLKATAWAPDGIIEGAESVDGREILAVQSHPEDMWADRPVYLGVFRWLVEQAAKVG